MAQFMENLHTLKMVSCAWVTFIKAKLVNQQEEVEAELSNIHYTLDFGPISSTSP